MKRTDKAVTLSAGSGALAQDRKRPGSPAAAYGWRKSSGGREEMQNKLMLVFLSALIASVFTSQFPYAQTRGSFPTHCRSDEFTYLDARMATIEYRDKADRAEGYSLIKNGKVLSLCADKQQEPFGKLAYRYGRIGKVELENVATPSNRFEIFSQSTSPHTGENVISFSRGNFTYYITEAIGQGHGISLYVFKSGQKILDLFSGTGEGTDYQSGLIEMDFHKSSSPIFLVAPPKDNLSKPD